MPAIDHVAGHKEWRVSAVWHREDGPAVIRADGSREWWINGVKIDHTKVGVLTVDAEGNRRWQLWDEEGKNTIYLHRTDGPAFISQAGLYQWWEQGNRHRAYGPAMYDNNGHAAWYYRGRLLADGVIPKELAGEVLQPRYLRQWFKRRRGGVQIRLVAKSTFVAIDELCKELERNAA